MEQVVTDTQSIVYNGGCQSKQVCAVASGSTPVGKKREMITCSRCCNTADDCNKRLCGLQEPSTNSVRCYHCDHRTSSQSEVKDPDTCVTLGYCQPNEKCYVSQYDVGGRDTYFYGCLNKVVCETLMKSAYQDYLVCVANKTQTLSNSDRDNICGIINKRSAFLCTSCCGDNGCNYGTCKELRERLFNLALLGKFDFSTLKIIP
ncbi:uncharacterized protein LOC132734538 [Ruditapes philippinarum]|uniref:uncharacterized protein LOC132734538 n=1 Tax=Ruditapes philippinarum TaxID=129788 RepID=UPI00295A6884|nr:uncharacterized protein LOC132734538 [Ruditapes philippinarum]